MADKIKEVAVEEAERIKSLTSDAARSGAYLYPLRVRCLLIRFSISPFDQHPANTCPMGLSNRASYTFCPTGPCGSR